jgi:hypothetical protein
MRYLRAASKGETGIGARVVGADRGARAPDNGRRPLPLVVPKTQVETVRPLKG